MPSEISWVSTAIVYQIYPRSFKDTNGDGIGDLNGIIKKLDYLKDLGINTIWLSPIYPSPMADFGYDVSDHKNIDPIFGSMKDFDTFIEKAHKNNIKVMLDYIPNHTSEKHPWFVQSKSSKTNPKRNFYIWADPKEDGSPPSNWISVFGGSAWDFDEKTGQYYLHTFSKEQPDLNWRNPEVADEMLNILKFWLNKGVDGFRVDAIYFLFKDPKFPDEPINPTYLFGVHEPFDQLLHPYTWALPETLDMMKKMMDVLDKYGDKFMVAEVYTSVDELIKIYNKVSHKHFAPFNFFLISLPFRANLHKQLIDNYDKAVGNLYTPTFVLGNHDRPRIQTRIGKDLAKIAAMLLLTLKGIPFLYYGDEIGMENVEIPPDKIQDVWEKNMPGLSWGRDGERTPMQWNSDKFAGFSDTEPWLPIAENYQEENAATQSKSVNSMLSLYKKLINLRKSSPALLYGDYLSWETKNPDVFAYSRTHQEGGLLIILNYSNKNCQVELPFKSGKVICNTFLDIKEGKEMNLEKADLRPYEGLLIEISA